MSETSSTDPCAWLTQLPELEHFAGDPPIAAAIASGDAHRLYAALEARRRHPRSPGEVAKLDRILARRRAFLVPVETAPALFTFNGIGSRIYGGSDAAPDGSFIGTYFVTVVYVPIWPMAQYLLLRDGRRYTFLGQVPLSRGMRRWRRGLVPAAVAALLALILFSSWSEHHAEVQLANGLDIPVTVTVGGEKAELAPGSRTSRKLRTGSVRFRAEATGGRVLEERTLEVTSREQLVAYNVLGAAPLAVEPVVYRRSGASGSPDVPPLEFLGGRSFATRRSVDYLFSAAPQQLQMGSRDDQRVRWRAFIPDGGWHVTVGYLRSVGREEEAAEVAARVAAAQPDDMTPLYEAVRLARSARGPDAAVEVARRGAEARPTVLDAQRLFSSALLAGGRATEARKLFGERAAREPSSAAALYLQARVAPHAEGLRLLAQAASRFPDDVWIHRALAWQLMVDGRTGEALSELERAVQLRSDEARPSLEMLAVLLTRLGRPEQAARRVLAAVLSKPTPREAVLYTQVARLAGRGAPQPPSHLVAALPDDPPIRTFAKALAAAVAGEEAPSEAELARIKDRQAAAVARIHASSSKDPVRALHLLQEARAEVRENVDPCVALLLAGEALWRGDEPLARTALLATWAEAPVEAILAFLRGAESKELSHLDPGELAALHVGRARAARAAGRNAQEDERRARELDPLRGAASNALVRWPAPRRSGRTGPG